MAFSASPPPFQITPEGMGRFNLGDAITRGLQNYGRGAEAIGQGIETAYKPSELAEKLLGSKLGNKLKQQEIDSSPYKQQLLQAQIQKALRGPAPVMSNYEKAVEGIDRIEQKYGKDSQEAKEARSYASRLAQGSQGTSLMVDPQTGAVSFSQGGSSRSGPQSQIVTDDQGNKVLVSKPTQPVTTAQQKLSLANEARQYVSENLEQPYVGTGSNIDLISDRKNYITERDPIKKKEIGDRLIKAAVAAKMAPEYASLQLNAQGVQPTVSSLKEQENSIKQGWAEGLRIAVNNLPQDLQKKVQLEHAKELQKLKDLRENYFSKGLPIKLHNNNSNNNNIVEWTLDQSGNPVKVK